MKQRVSGWVWVVIILVLAAVAATALGACGSPNQARPIVCATYQAPDGTWMEEDNEVVDSDPCDLDDQFEDQGGYDLRKVKPVPKQTPIGGKKKRF